MGLAMVLNQACILTYHQIVLLPALYSVNSRQNYAKVWYMDHCVHMHWETEHNLDQLSNMEVKAMQLQGTRTNLPVPSFCDCHQTAG